MEVSPSKLARLSAAFAISNIGHEVPKDITDSPFNEYATSRSEIDNWAGHLMETDEHEEIFADEAEMWHDDLSKKTNAEVLRIHGPHCPWIQQIIDA